MNERELFNTLHDEILDYVEDELLLRCANWGYEVHQMLLEHKMYIMQEEEQGEQSSPFMYAVATAVIVGEFAQRAYNDHFSKEVNLIIYELGLDFDQVSGFINKDINKERFELLEGIEGVSLEDIWEAICERKKDIYKSLVHIYKQQGENDPDYKIYTSLITIFDEKDEETGETFSRIMDKTFGYPEMEAYQYVNNGFQ